MPMKNTSVPRPEAKLIDPVPPLPDWEDVPLPGKSNEEDVSEPSSRPQLQAPSMVNVVPEESMLPVSRPQAVPQQNQTMQPTDTSTVIVSDDAPTLTIEEVREHWEYIKKRVKSKKDGAKIAALLNGYIIIGVEGTQALPVVVIRANADFYYSTLQQNVSHHATVEWAMKVELKRECKLRLLAPGQSGPARGSVPSPTPYSPHDPSNSTSARTPQHSPSREQSVSPPEIRLVSPKDQAQNNQNVQVTDWPQKQNPIASAAPSIVTTKALHSSPLAITNVMRDNTTRVPSASGETRQEIAAKKAKSDQVVQEAMRMFKAEIKNVQLK
jgi:hypothetical protein